MQVYITNVKCNKSDESRPIVPLNEYRGSYEGRIR